MKVRFLVLTVVAMLGIACQVMAGPVTITQVANGGGTDAGGGNLANTTTNQIRINAPAGTAIASMQILLQLTGGTINEHPLGTSGPPGSALLGVFSTLQWDSFVAAGAASDDAANQLDTPTVFGPSLELGGPGVATTFSPTTYDATFIPAPGSDSVGKQNWLAAQLTLNNTANGTFKFKVDFGNSTSAGSGFGNFGTLSVTNGRVVPEPATVTLLGLAGFGVMGLVRRRRS